MPSALTHYVFNSQHVKNPKYRKIFLLAGQGADTFFFYGYNLVKRKNKKELRQLGYDIHSIDPDKLYMKMLTYSFSKEGEEKEVLVNFTRGFIYHYVLDRIVHPFIFYHTGFPYTNKRFNRNHGRLESIVDTLVMKKYHDKHSTRSILKAKNKHVKLCSKMLYDVLKDEFNNPYLTENTYYLAYKDYRFVRLLLDSRFGFKKWIFNTFMNKSLLNTLSQPKKVKDNVTKDYLNENHHDWRIPCNGKVTTDSMDDLFYKAELDGRIIDNIIDNFKDNIVTQRKITKFTNNTNHDGRELDKYMTYFKSVFND